MDSTLNALIDEDENETLHSKYQELISLSPKTKSQVNSSKDLKPITLVLFPQISTPTSPNICSKSTINSITNNLKQYTQNNLQLTQDSSSSNKLATPMEHYNNKRTLSSGDCSASLSPKKSYCETFSDYTFKLHDANKKVRFRLGSDNYK